MFLIIAPNGLVLILILFRIINEKFLIELKNSLIQLIGNQS